MTEIDYSFAKPGYGPNIYLSKIFEEEEQHEHRVRESKRLNIETHA